MNLLLQAESIDNYLQKNKDNYVNNLARINFSYTTDYNNYYIIIKEYINKYSIFNNIHIVQLNPSAENGYPHTRPMNIICLPSNAKFPNLEETLFHEVIHIHQRNNKELWHTFLKQEGWTPVESSLIPERWRIKCRNNPDTILEPFWKYKNRYIPLPIFIKDHNPIFHEINVMWYDLETGILEHEKNYPLPFVKQYGTNLSQPEHPYEIYAVLFSKEYPFDEDWLKNRLNN